MSATDDKPDDGGFISRWSRRKIEARTPPEASPSNPSIGGATGAKTPQTPHQSLTLAPESSNPQPSAPSPELPTLESLTPESDFTPFMTQGVESSTRNSALKTLFTDPHFNKMDGLDTYIDDYTGHTPIPMEMLRSLKQAQMLFADEKKEEGQEGLEKAQPERVDMEMPCDQSAAPLEVEIAKEASLPNTQEAVRPEVSKGNSA
jgi:hypothetical protein